MKIKNKKTGEIREIREILIDGMFKVSSLAELNEEWEDVLEEPKEFWFVDADGKVKETTYLTEADRADLKNFGNYFETKEEAEKAVEKLKAWKRLKDKGFRITLRGWKGSAWLEANWGHLQGDYSDVITLFGGE